MLLPLLSLLLPLSASPAPGSPPDQDRRPNVVFFLIDDLGWRDLGYAGSTFYSTPHVDSLAATGTVFTQAYAACPVCSPTRASILSGKYPARMASTDWFGAIQPEAAAARERYKKPLLPAPYRPQLPLEELTLAEALREAGYATGFFGKWHLGGEGYLPQDQGFDVNVGGHHRGSPPGGYFSPYTNPQMESGPEGEHLPARLAEECATFIEANAEQPFLAYFSMYSVHTPLQAREDLKEKYRARREEQGLGPTTWGIEGERKVREVQEHAVYGAMVEAMDLAVGRVLAELEEHGLIEDTIIVFFSDNGGLSTSEGHPTSNLPLRAGKGWLYEGGVREPCVIRWPGVTAPGSVCDTPVISTDFYPTLLEALGLPARPEQHLDGESLVAALRDPAAPLPQRALYWHYPHYGNQGASPGSSIRVGDWKLVEWFEPGRKLELYDLASDPGETTNLAAGAPERAGAMRARLQGWRDAVGARYPTANPRAESR